MLIYFTEEEIKNQINIIEVEDVVLEGIFIKVENNEYTLSGKATIEGEIYHDFQIWFTLEKNPMEINCSSILDNEWEEYDFIF